MAPSGRQVQPPLARGRRGVDGTHPLEGSIQDLDKLLPSRRTSKDSADRIRTDDRATLRLAEQHVTAWLNLHVRDELRVAPGHGAAAARQDARVRSVEVR